MKNNLSFSSIKDISWKSYSSVCIVGAGKAGAYMYMFLRMQDVTNVFIADNDKTKYGHFSHDGYITSVDEAVCKGADIYLIGFIDNDEIRIEEIYDQLINIKIEINKIRIVDFSEEWQKEIALDYTIYSCEKIHPLKKKSDISSIRFVADGYRIQRRKDYTGGGAWGAMNMQYRFLGEIYKSLPIEYMSYPTYDYDFLGLYNNFSGLLKFIELIECDNNACNALYIANDIFCAYILARYDLRCVWIHHGQGDIVCDLKAFGAELSEREVSFLTQIQMYVIEKGIDIYFPSLGARKYFLDTLQSEANLRKTEPLYNCIYDYPKIIHGKSYNKDKLIFLSIGQMTSLKGMDRIPDFLNRIRKLTGKKIEWIAIARDGNKASEIENRIINLNHNVTDLLPIDYVHISDWIDHQKCFEYMYKCDFYIMLHRISIFDFATLEAMYCGMPVILSDVPGNDEFNILNNILLINKDTSDADIMKYITGNREFGRKNEETYNDYFSKRNFVSRYNRLIDCFLEEHSEQIG